MTQATILSEFSLAFAKKGLSAEKLRNASRSKLTPHTQLGYTLHGMRSAEDKWLRVWDHSLTSTIVPSSFARV